MVSETTLRKTPLYQEHVRLKAKMVPFGGWDMPLQYAGILAEYGATRRDVTVFDTSHMGEFFVEGEAAASGLDRLVTQRLSDLPAGSCRYGALLNEQGGVLDDLIVYRLAGSRWMVVVNGSTMEKDAAQFRSVITDEGKFSNVSFSTGKVDIQGPKSLTLLSTFIHGIEKLKYYTFAELNVLGTKAIVSRTGYTGELGYEIYFPSERVAKLWNKILSLGAKPAGLGARDVLRLEMGYSLYGHELAENISALEAGMDRFIDWDKDFIGKAGLLTEKETGVKRRLVGFLSKTRRSPRGDFHIFSPDGKKIGIVTSGTFAPALERGIGMGLVDAGFETMGGKVLIGKEGNMFEAQITERPFYKQGTYRS